MRAVSVLFGGSLMDEAFVPLSGVGKNALNLALERAKAFPSTEKVVLLGLESYNYSGLPQESNDFSLILRENWTRKGVLEVISQVQTGFDLVYFAWADCPFLDPALTGDLTERHIKYAAHYSYADGFPYGFSPELLSPGTGGILFSIDKDGDIPLERDALLTVIQKDINAFDIETEISPVDLRLHRLCLTADSKRNLLLINRWLEASKDFPNASIAADLVEKNPELLRTLPAFYNIQVIDTCPQSCSFCPWPITGRSSSTASMEMEKFHNLLDKIEDFSSDAVISLSLWGEISLHPQKMELIHMVLERPALSLIIETSGIGWQASEIETLAVESSKLPIRKSPLLSSSLSWVISLDAHDPARYKEIRGSGFSEATACAKQLLNLFPGKAYVQAVRLKDAEDDIEAFYRFWREAIQPKAAAQAGVLPSSNHVIIQKYDHFCGVLPKLQASDLSPIIRRPCWHIMRDLYITVEGDVLLCREDLEAFGLKKEQRFNVFIDPMEKIWEAGKKLYIDHSMGIYPDKCGSCDEYYTYNF